MVYLYVEINSFCIAILALLLWKSLTGGDLRTKKRPFVTALISFMALFTADLLWACIEYGSMEFPASVNWAVNVAYYVLSGVAGYYCFFFLEFAQGSRLCDTGRKRILCALPAAVLIVLSLLSIKTGWIFYIDEQNAYQRGPLFFFHLPVTYGYPLIPATKALWRAIHTKDYGKRVEYFTLSSFVILPILLGLLQVAFPVAPMMCVGSTLAFLLVFLNLQEQQISLDPLTQLNNRRHLRRYLSNRMLHYVKGESLYLFIMDVDYFKTINDRYGHVEGDNALDCMASALRRVCKDKNYFAARYGGDEFVLIAEVPDEEAARGLRDQIQEAVAAEQIQAKLPFSFTVSVGWAQYVPGKMTVEQDWIAKADAVLYQVKAARV